MTALNALVGELSVEMSLPIALATYWIPAQQEFAEILEKQVSVAHACEAETSMLLALRPDLVVMTELERVNPPSEWGGGASDVYVWQSVSDWSPSGVAGVPNAASAEKGEKLLDAAAKALADRGTVGSGGWRRSRRGLPPALLAPISARQQPADPTALYIGCAPADGALDTTTVCFAGHDQSVGWYAA
jgi:hypothetical protein